MGETISSQATNIRERYITKTEITVVSSTEELDASNRYLDVGFTELSDLSTFEYLETARGILGPNTKFPKSLRSVKVLHVTTDDDFEMPSYIEHITVRKIYYLHRITVPLKLRKLTISGEISLRALSEFIYDGIPILEVKIRSFDNLGDINYFQAVVEFILFDTLIVDLSKIKLVNLKKLSINNSFRKDTKHTIIYGEIEVDEIIIKSVELNIKAKLRCKSVTLNTDITTTSRIDLDIYTTQLSINIDELKSTNLLDKSDIFHNLVSLTNLTLKRCTIRKHILPYLESLSVKYVKLKCLHNYMELYNKLFPKLTTLEQDVIDINTLPYTLLHLKCDYLADNINLSNIKLESLSVKKAHSLTLIPDTLVSIECFNHHNIDLCSIILPSNLKFLFTVLRWRQLNIHKKPKLNAIVSNYNDFPVPYLYRESFLYEGVVRHLYIL